MEQRIGKRVVPSDLGNYLEPCSYKATGALLMYLLGDEKDIEGYKQLIEIMKKDTGVYALFLLILRMNSEDYEKRPFYPF